MARRPSAGGASGRRKKTGGRKGGAVGAAMMTVRHYCQGIGDCHLLRFRQRDGKTLHMLIDCGVHLSVSGGADMMRRIVADIAKTTKTIDVLVVTHEHWDHVSGFLAAAQEFKELTIKDVWFSWAEDPKDPLARTLETYKGKALSALQAADRHLAAAAPGGQPSALSQSLSGVLGFYFGAAGEKVRAARNAARDLATSKVVYHQPGTGPISLGEESGVNVYVLGPPKDAKAIGIEEIASELYGHGIAWGAAGERSAEQSVQSDENAPFDPEYGWALDEVLPPAGARVDAAPGQQALGKLLSEHYAQPLAAESWRRIDQDWAVGSTELALKLDKGVNNTSLVLAFEFEATGRVALFTADAQVGNWLSWHALSFTRDGKTFSGQDLIERTVYLKVGHHGSHNATPKGKGLELMNSPDLSAFVPVNEKDAKKVGWGRMPLPDVVAELKKRTSARITRADDAWIATGQVPAALSTPEGSIAATRCQPGLWVEFDVN